MEDNTSFAPGNNSINNSVPPPSPQYSAPNPKHLPKLVTLLVLSLTLGLAVYAGILYWQNQKLGEDYAISFTPRPSPSVTPDVTADWKTYTNTKYGFEFKYPGNWIIDTSSLRVVLREKGYPDTDIPPNLSLDVNPTISFLDWKKIGVRNFNDFIDKYSHDPDPQLVNVETVFLGGKTGFKASAGPNVFGGGVFYYVSLDDGAIIEIKTYDGYYTSQILSTFKFTK